MNKRLLSMSLTTRMMFLFTAVLLSIAPVLKSATPFKKEVFPQLSSEQYQRIRTLQPDLTKPVYVVLGVVVVRGDVTQVNVVGSCGVSDVDRTVANWVWKTYHYGQNFSGMTSEKVQVNSPIVRHPPLRLSWRGWQMVRRADPLDQKGFEVRFMIAVQHGKIVSVQVLNGSGLPEVDQECCEFVRKNWTFTEGTSQNMTISLTIQQRYYP
jgi:hypothetical protein